MMTNNTKVADSLVILCKVIMPILRNPSFTWKLSDELDFLENYIKMMQLRKTERFAIEVQNTGSFLEAEKVAVVNRKIAEGTPDNESIGLCNIRKRLNLLYGEKGDIWLESSPERGVLVYICF